MLEQWVNQSWYGGFQWTRAFWPLMSLYRSVVDKKREAFLQNPPDKVSLPVVVVGNITAGGTGKTPVVQTLVRKLLEEGYKPAIVTRGYGGSLQTFPHLISEKDSPSSVGDEPYMMYSSLNIPVVVDPQRNRAAKFCTEESSLDVNVIICDDGLQHYALNRDIEFCVIDAQREFGNGHLIPVGPLREPLSRLDSVDFVVRNGGSGEDGFKLQPTRWVNLKSGEEIPPHDLKAKLPSNKLKAVAGIGNPQRFFDTVEELGFDIESQAFPDHHDFSEQDFDADCVYLMTQKDAVKVKSFSTDQMWYLEVSAALPETLLKEFINKLSNIKGHTDG